MRPKRNEVFRELRTPKYRKRIVRARKGAGSYQKPSNRRPDQRRDGGSDARVADFLGRAGFGFRL